MLSKGTYARFPTIVQEKIRLAQPKPPKDEERAATISLVEDTISSMLAFSELVPSRLRKGFRGIENGKAVFCVEGEFEVSLTVHPRDLPNTPIIGPSTTFPLSPPSEEDRDRVVWGWKVLDVIIFVGGTDVSKHWEDPHRKEELRLAAQARVDAAHALTQILEDAQTAENEANLLESDAASLVGSTTSSGVFRLPPIQQKQLQQLRQFQASHAAFRVTSNPALPRRKTKWPLVELYDYLHTWALLQQIEFLFSQRLSESRWLKEVEIERSVDDWGHPVLRGRFWRNPSVGLGGYGKDETSSFDKQLRRRNVLEVSIKIPNDEVSRPTGRVRPRSKRWSGEETETWDVEGDQPVATGPENLFGREKPTLVAEPKFLEEAEFELDAHVIRAMRPSIRTSLTGPRTELDQSHGPLATCYDSFLSLRAYLAADGAKQPFLPGEMLHDFIIPAVFSIDIRNLSLESMLNAAAGGASRLFLKRLQTLLEVVQFPVTVVGNMDALDVTYVQGKSVRVAVDGGTGRVLVTPKGESFTIATNGNNRLMSRMTALSKVMNESPINNIDNDVSAAAKNPMVVALRTLGCDIMVDALERFGSYIGLRPQRRIPLNTESLVFLNSQETSFGPNPIRADLFQDTWEQPSVDHPEHIVYLQFPSFPLWYLAIRVTPSSLSSNTSQLSPLAFSYSAWLLAITSSRGKQATSLEPRNVIEDEFALSFGERIDMHRVEQVLVGIRVQEGLEDSGAVPSPASSSVELPDISSKSGQIEADADKKRKRSTSEPENETPKRPRLSQQFTENAFQTSQLLDILTRTPELEISMPELATILQEMELSHQPSVETELFSYTPVGGSIPLHILSCIERLCRRRITIQELEDQLRDQGVQSKIHNPSRVAPNSGERPLAALGTWSVKVPVSELLKHPWNTDKVAELPADDHLLHVVSPSWSSIVNASQHPLSGSEASFSRKSDESHARCSLPFTVSSLYIHPYNETADLFSADEAQTKMRVVAAMRLRKENLPQISDSELKLSSDTLLWRHDRIDSCIPWIISNAGGVAFIATLAAQCKQRSEVLSRNGFVLSHYSVNELGLRYRGWSYDQEFTLVIRLNVEFEGTGIEGSARTGNPCQVQFGVVNGRDEDNPHLLVANHVSTTLARSCDIVQMAKFLRVTWKVFSSVGLSVSTPGEKLLTVYPLSERHLRLLSTSGDFGVDVMVLSDRVGMLCDTSFVTPWTKAYPVHPPTSRIPGFQMIEADVLQIALRDMESASASVLPLPFGIVVPLPLLSSAIDTFKKILRVLKAVYSMEHFGERRQSNETDVPHPNSRNQSTIPDSVEVIVKLDPVFIEFHGPIVKCELSVNWESNLTWSATFEVDDDRKVAHQNPAPVTSSADLDHHLNNLGSCMSQQLTSTPHLDLVPLFVSMANLVAVHTDVIVDIAMLLCPSKKV
ncbi:hypothetical protein M427DRAFT_470831 [Gonapodya prolifera JEL478]|uniref:Mediator of RNA polymerase II transcription subunit 14 n=1 Tax=Gonapodya prolifera (strain JEL478) TaxID=1344416 RepID=A0A139ARB0_GONPJ|nr:hypothetical protein M427DRAFT_470831 [Gonapodya prolifera JEL478]|eukprot:KXS19194.1 hypothetical protein M427DRAFT_470831 [Gonapodya prolifera JEL478]